MKHALYQVVADVEGQPLTIRDIGHSWGLPTVTNDIEWVVQTLYEQGRLPSSRRLIYFDSDDKLDGVLHKDGKFLDFDIIPFP